MDDTPIVSDDGEVVGGTFDVEVSAVDFQIERLARTNCVRWHRECRFFLIKDEFPNEAVILKRFSS